MKERLFKLLLENINKKLYRKAIANSDLLSLRRKGRVMNKDERRGEGKNIGHVVKKNLENHDFDGKDIRNSVIKAKSKGNKESIVPPPSTKLSRRKTATDTFRKYAEMTKKSADSHKYKGDF